MRFESRRRMGQRQAELNQWHSSDIFKTMKSKLHVFSVHLVTECPQMDKTMESHIRRQIILAKVKKYSPRFYSVSGKIFTLHFV